MSVFSFLWGGTPRSPKWNAVREQFLRGKKCSGCGATKELEAHHVIPFHVDQSKELDPANLICLCRDCHFHLGHLRDWSCSNPHVCQDADLYLSRIVEYRKRIKACSEG